MTEQEKSSAEVEETREAEETTSQPVHTEKKRRIRKFIILAVAEVFTLALIFSYAYVARLMGAIQKPDDFNTNQVRNEVMSPEQKKHMTGYRTIAVFGVDSRDGNVNKGTNADVIMLCNINRGTGEIKIVSVFRDTYLNINDGSTYNKINAAYANGGAAQALAAINRNLDLDVTEYVTLTGSRLRMESISWEALILISARQNSAISTPLLQKPLKNRVFLPSI